MRQVKSLFLCRHIISRNYVQAATHVGYLCQNRLVKSTPSIFIIYSLGLDFKSLSNLQNQTSKLFLQKQKLNLDLMAKWHENQIFSSLILFSWNGMKFRNWIGSRTPVVVIDPKLIPGMPLPIPSTIGYESTGIGNISSSIRMGNFPTWYWNLRMKRKKEFWGSIWIWNTIRLPTTKRWWRPSSLEPENAVKHFVKHNREHELSYCCSCKWPQNWPQVDLKCWTSRRPFSFP